MKRLLALSALLALGSAAPAGAVVLQADTHSYPITSQKTVRLEFPVGELNVVANNDNKVRLTLRVKCRGNQARCADRASDLKLDAVNSGDELRLKITGYPKWNSNGFTLIGELQVPRSLAVDLDMGVGALNVEGIEGDLEVELGVGDADIHSTKSKTKSVSVDTGVGDATIRNAGTGSSSRGFIGREARWTGGSGASKVRLNVGVGDATVHLD